MERVLTVEEVELAERYAAALERIQQHHEDKSSWSEDDVETAEGYLQTLVDIEAKIEWHPDEDMVKQAGDYLCTLQAIEEHESTWTEDDVKQADEYLGTLKEIEAAQNDE